MTEEQIIFEYLSQAPDKVETIAYTPEILAWIIDNCSKITTPYADYYKVNENWYKIAARKPKHIVT